MLCMNELKGEMFSRKRRKKRTTKREDDLAHQRGNNTNMFLNGKNENNRGTTETVP